MTQFSSGSAPLERTVCGCRWFHLDSAVGLVLYFLIHENYIAHLPINTYAGIVLLGFHAMMGTQDGVLNHTQSSKSENRYWYHGVESGELVQSAVIAGYFGVPVIMVTGDEATCRESETFFGKSCVNVAVKKGLARESAILYPFAETRQALYDGAKRAMRAIPHCKPYRLALPIKAKKQHLVFETGQPPKIVTKEGLIPDGLHLLDF
jgi:D-amino peptidase